MSCIEDYYQLQAGNGIAGFSGVRYQKGHGFFGRLLSGAVLPFLKFIGKNALSAGANIARDLVDSDNFSISNIRDSAKTRLKEVASQALKRGAEKLLSGNGIMKKRKRYKKKAKKIIKKKAIKNKKVIKVKRKRCQTKKKRFLKKKKSTKIKRKNCFL